MRKGVLLRPLLFAAAMAISGASFGQEGAEPELEPGAVEIPRDKEAEGVRLFAKTGLGFDSNVFQAPSAPYVDYYAGLLLGGANPLVVPQKKSGFFVPYALGAATAKKLNGDSALVGSAKMDGRYYPAGSVSYANQYTARLRGGSEYVLGREGKQENTVYIGALLTKHQQIYTNHATGLPKTTIVSGTDISNRYNYMGIGVEAAYKHKTGSVSYGLKAQLIQNTYDDPVVVSKLDHTYYKVGGNVGFHVAPKTRLAFDARYAVRDFSKRHTHDLTGVYSVNNPLLKYSFNTVGAKLRHQFADAWSAMVDYEYVQRVDHFVGYNDYSENKYGAGLQYGQDGLTAKLALHHFARNYPNAFAFDVLGMPQKTYNGNDIEFNAGSRLSNSMTLWADLLLQNRDTTDARYAYSRKQVMVGITWVQ